jgi:hypothetical protein
MNMTPFHPFQQSQHKNSRTEKNILTPPRGQKNTRNLKQTQSSIAIEVGTKKFV